MGLMMLSMTVVNNVMNELDSKCNCLEILEPQLKPNTVAYLIECDSAETVKEFFKTKYRR